MSNLIPKTSTFPTRKYDPQEFRSDFYIKGCMNSFQSLWIRLYMYLSFVKDMYVDGKNVARNGRKTAIYDAPPSTWKETSRHLSTIFSLVVKLVGPKKDLRSKLILDKKSDFLGGPTMFKIPQTNWHSYLSYPFFLLSISLLFWKVHAMTLMTGLNQPE